MRAQRKASKRIGLLLVAVLLLVFGLIAGNARADYVLGFDLVTANTDLRAYSGPYAHLQISMSDHNVNEATITLTAYSGFHLGSNSALALNTNGSATASDFVGGNIIDVSSGYVNSFGDFNLVIDNKGGWSQRFTSLTFTLTKNSGTWFDPASVLAKNDYQCTAASHIFPDSDPCGSGYAGVHPTMCCHTPIPGAAWMLGFGLTGLVALRPRLKK